MDSRINPTTLLTPQEHVFIGSTSEIWAANDKKVDVYTSEAVLDKTSSPEEANAARQELLGYSLSFIGVVLFGTEDALIKLSPLDLETGRTLEDPVAGLQHTDEKTGRRSFVENPFWTNQLRKALIAQNQDIFLRKPGIKGEGPLSASSENKA